MNPIGAAAAHVASEARRLRAEVQALDEEVQHLERRAAAARARRDHLVYWEAVWSDPDRWVELERRHRREVGLECGGPCCVHLADPFCPRHSEIERAPGYWGFVYRWGADSCAAAD